MRLGCVDTRCHVVPYVFVCVYRFTYNPEYRVTDSGIRVVPVCWGLCVRRLAGEETVLWWPGSCSCFSSEYFSPIDVISDHRRSPELALKAILLTNHCWSRTLDVISYVVFMINISSFYYFWQCLTQALERDSLPPVTFFIKLCRL